ncbi:MAG: PAS domain S-box-containing protein [Gammaproteobacteria bacterium]
MDYFNFSISPLILIAFAAVAYGWICYVVGRRSICTHFSTSAATSDEQNDEPLDTRLTEARLRTILDSEPECVKTVNRNKCLLFMNPAGLKMIAAKDMNSVYLAPLSDLVIPEHLDIFEASHAEVFRGKRSRVQFEIEALDGTRLYMDQVSTPIFDPDELGKVIEMLAVTRDITEQRQATKQLIQARDDAEAADRAKSRFIATMSHELRTPLNGVLGMAQVLSSTHLDVDQHDMLGTLSKAGENLLHVINDILDYSRIEAGRMVLDFGNVDLHSVRSNLSAVHEIIARQQGLDLVFEGFDDTTLRLGDEKRIIQLLHNIVGNAVKFTDSGEVRIAFEDLSSIGESGQVTFTVTDTGIGIQKNQIDALFKPFAQADESSTRRHGGTGLGLPIARGLTEAMGGQIILSRCSKVGTSVSVKLPLPLQTTTREEHSVDLAVLHADTANLITAKRVLVVEDDLFNQRTMTGMLQLLNVSWTLAENGQEAVEMADATRFDAIIMDIHMPVMNGWHALENIRRNENRRDNASVPVIACTADVRPSHTIELHKHGFYGIIEKPFEMEYLRHILTQALIGGTNDGEQAGTNATQASDQGLMERPPIQTPRRH